MRFRDRLASLGYADYQDYLEGGHWRQFRREFYREKNRVLCEACGGNDSRISLHHKTYERLGRERFEDVVMLCEDCHDRVHSYDGDVEKATANFIQDVYHERLINLFAVYVGQVKRFVR